MLGGCGDMFAFTVINSGLFFLGIFASLPFLLIKSVECQLNIPMPKGISISIRKVIKN